MKKLLNIVALFAVMSLLLSSVVLADTSDVDVTEVEINGNEVDFGSDGEMIAVEEGETIEVQVKLEADADVEDIEVSAKISGYEYSDYNALEDTTTLFDMEDGTTKYVTLEIELPVQLDKDEYYLRLSVTDKNSEALDEVVRLYIEPNRHGIDIADVVFSPGSEVEAGRSLLTTVELQNFGDKDEEDVKVTVSIDELGVSSTDYIDVVETNGDSESVSYETSEELFLSIPDCAEAGVYEVEVTAEYDEYETVTKSYSLTVVEGDYCDENSAEKLAIAVGPESQSVNAGEQAVYVLALTNEGSETGTFTFEVSTGDWASASMSESLVVLGEGDSEVVYLYVDTAATATEGSHTATLVVSNEGNVLETISLTADVEVSATESTTETSSDFSLRNALELALIILVVLLVIVGLIVGFARLRKDEDEEQTYY